MAQWAQAPFTKPDDSSVLHKTHMVKGEKLLWERRGRAPATGGCLHLGQLPICLTGYRKEWLLHRSYLGQAAPWCLAEESRAGLPEIQARGAGTSLH